MLFPPLPSCYLTPVLQIIVMASAAFGPLQATTTTLLHIMETIEVHCCFPIYPLNISWNLPPVCETEGQPEPRQCH